MESFKPKGAPERRDFGTRADKVIALAQQLHARGITSSFADAKRLAEGMVEIEKKVIHETPKAAPQVLSLSDDFAQFVAQVVLYEDKPVREAVRSEPLHTSIHAESPEHAISQKHVEAQHEPQVEVSKSHEVPHVEPAYTAPEPAHVTRVVQGDAGVAVTQVETAPAVTVVKEEVIVQSDPVIEAIIESAPTVSEPSVAPEPAAEAEEDIPEKTVELPKSDKPVEKVDLAKQHGVDLFEMFKKKG